MEATSFLTSPGSLAVSYFASAELGCLLQLGWPLPARILDLYVEFRVATNGFELPCGRGLLGALQFYGLPHLDADEKGEMQALAIRGGPYSAEERQALVSYCFTDVIALRALLPPLWADIRARPGGPSSP